MKCSVCGECTSRQCKNCKVKYQREYCKNNHEKVLISNRNYIDKVRFGMSRNKIIKDTCERCGGTNRLSIHHKDGQGRNAINPNNDPSNFETLCNDCHIDHHIHIWSKKYSKEWQEKVKLFSGKPHSYVAKSLKIDKCTVKAIREQIGYSYYIKKEIRKCSIYGCKNLHAAKNVCMHHYNTIVRKGDHGNVKR